jgi:hypothetical protein
LLLKIGTLLTSGKVVLVMQTIRIDAKMYLKDKKLVKMRLKNITIHYQLKIKKWEYKKIYKIIIKIKSLINKCWPKLQYKAFISW